MTDRILEEAPPEGNATIMSTYVTRFTHPQPMMKTLRYGRRTCMYSRD
jgi:hypothetical protein